MIWFYCQQRAKHVLRFLKTANYGQLVTVGLFLLVFASVGLGVYGLLEAGFQSVADNEFLQVALPLFVYELFLLVVAALVFASSLIFGIFSLFKNKQDQWVLSSPQYSSLLTEKLLSVNVISLWPLAIIAIPALIAVQSVFGVGTLGFLYGLLTILLLGVLASTAALVLIITLGYLITVISNSTRWQLGITTLISIISVISLLLFAGSWIQLGSIDIVRFFEATNLERSTANIAAIQDMFRYFPSHWVAQTLSALQTSSVSAGIATSWPIVVTTGAMLAV